MLPLKSSAAKTLSSTTPGSFLLLLGARSRSFFLFLGCCFQCAFLLLLRRFLLVVFYRVSIWHARKTEPFLYSYLQNINVRGGRTQKNELLLKI
jgi:hypothetical protein